MSMSDDALLALDAYWRAANYLTVGQIYLRGNPLLRETLRPEHIKPRLLGHWGTSPGLSLIYVHLNRLIRDVDANVIYLAGPGHGGPALLANAYLEGTYSEIYPAITRDAEGLRRLFRQFSTPGGVPSHVSVPTPGRRRAGLRARPRIRGSVRQPGPARRRRDRRRRGGDGAARGVLEGDPFPESGAGRRGPAHPAPQRLQDRRPHGARPEQRRRGREPAQRARLRAAFRRRPRADGHARALRGDARDMLRGDPGDPGGGAARRRARAAAALAGDRAPHAEGLDGPEGRGRPTGRGHVPRAPGPAAERQGEPRAPATPGGVDEELPSRGALRRRRPSRSGPRRARAERRPPDGCQSPRQRRQAARRPRSPRFHRILDCRHASRRGESRIDAPARQDDA